MEVGARGELGGLLSMRSQDIVAQYNVAVLKARQARRRPGDKRSGLSPSPLSLSLTHTHKQTHTATCRSGA